MLSSTPRLMELRRYNIEIAENLQNIHYLCIPKTIFAERCIAFTTRFLTR